MPVRVQRFLNTTFCCRFSGCLCHFKLTYTFPLYNQLYVTYSFVCNGSLRTFACSSICFGLLATNRKSFTMTDTSVASDFLQSLDIQSDFTTKITFNCHCFINYSTDFLNIIICQVSDTNVRIYTCLSKNLSALVLPIP